MFILYLILLKFLFIKFVSFDFYLNEYKQDCILGEGEIEVYRYFSPMFGDSYMVTITVPKESKRSTSLLTKNVPLLDATYDVWSRIEFGRVTSILSSSGKHLKEYKPTTKLDSDPALFRVGEIVRSSSFSEDESDCSGAGIVVKKNPADWRWWVDDQKSKSKSKSNLNCIIL